MCVEQRDPAVPVGDIEAAVEAGVEAATRRMNRRWERIEFGNRDMRGVVRGPATAAVEAAAPVLAGPAFERGREAGLQEARELVAQFVPTDKPDPDGGPVYCEWLGSSTTASAICSALAVLGSYDHDVSGPGQENKPAKSAGEPDGREADGATPSASPAVTKDGGGSSGPGVDEGGATDDLDPSGDGVPGWWFEGGFWVKDYETVELRRGDVFLDPNPYGGVTRAAGPLRLKKPWWILRCVAAAPVENGGEA